MTLPLKISNKLQHTPVAPGQAVPRGHYQPTSEYNPTMRVCRCANCKAVGLVEFRGGFNLREGDRLMEGRTIEGQCGTCLKWTTLKPIKVTEAQRKEIGIMYDVQKTLEYYVERGIPIPKNGIVLPHGRVKAHEHAKRNPGSDGPADGRSAPKA